MTAIARFKKRFYFVAAGYFRFFANRAFKRWHPRVIAITGSVGKTTMLHLLEQQLGSKAHYSHDANSAFGIAFDLVGLRGITGSKLRWFYLIFAVPIKALFYKHTEEFYVVEIDGERPHEAEFLASWLRPEATLWISLGRSHAIQFERQVQAGEFKDVDHAITHEFATIPEHTQQIIFIDRDVELMRKAIAGIRRHGHLAAEVVECSKSALEKYAIRPDGTDFTLAASTAPAKPGTTPAKPGVSAAKPTTFHFAAPMPRDLAIQLTMLQALCKYLHQQPQTDFSALPLPPGRSSYFPGKNGLKLIDSSYNAHLISVESILNMAKAMRTSHKWLVIGDIVDQGSIEGEEHRKLADIIAATRPEQVILVGRRTQKYTAPRLKTLGLQPYCAATPQLALKYIEQHTTGKETIIFKGSQYLEWIIEKLLKNPADAARLPRREKAAVKRRARRGLDS